MKRVSHFQCSFSDDFAHVMNLLDIARSSILISTTHSRDLQRVVSRTFFIDCVTITLSRKSVRSRFTDTTESAIYQMKESTNQLIDLETNLRCK